MARGPRLCIFCGAPADSKEHLWPTWLHDLLGPVPKGVRHDKRVYNYHPSTGEVITGPQGRQGDQRTIRVRAVCAACNNGWMNKLEGEVRPHLTPIVAGDAVTLTPDHVEILARWIALKTMVAEHDAQDTALTPQIDRTTFWKAGTIPPYYRIYVAHNIGPEPLFYLRNSQCIMLDLKGPNPPLDGVAKNIQSVTMVAGRAILHVTSARIENFVYEENARVEGFHDRCRIWPIDGVPVSFPRRPRLDRKGIEFLSGALNRYVEIHHLAGRTTWLDQ